jgi:hypothetical protein
MDFSLLLTNITNPAFLFLLLGVIAVRLKSDLEIPANSSKFISLYLLFSIGFKGGQELAHEAFTAEVLWSMLLGFCISLCIPAYTFFLIKKRVGEYNAAAIAASYGSVSAVTFVTAAAFLDLHQMSLPGHLVAVMALMESPAIVMSLLLLRMTSKEEQSGSMGSAIRHSLTNGSVLLIMGSLLIGFMADAKQAEGIKPFTNDIFKGFLAIFLLDMGISCGKRLESLTRYGWFPLVFGTAVPLVNGIAIAFLSQFITHDVAPRFILAVLAASASYIAVPAAMKLAVPKADNGLYLPMALAITFPMNITLGLPVYFAIASGFGG